MKKALKRKLFHQQVSQLVNGFIEWADQTGSRSVLFTASQPGEGASSIAREFAKGLAGQSGKKVLLIDGNDPLGQPRLPLGLEPAGDGDGDDTALQPEIYGLNHAYDFTVVNAGRGNGYSLKVRRLGRTLERLKKDYDFLVVDASPVLRRPDIIVWFSLIEALYLIIAAEKTRVQVAERALATIRKYPIHLMGAILNRRQYPIPDNIYQWLYK